MSAGYYCLKNIYVVKRFGSKFLALNELFAARVNNLNMSSRKSNTCTTIPHVSKLF